MQMASSISNFPFVRMLDGVRAQPSRDQIIEPGVLGFRALRATAFEHGVVRHGGALRDCGLGAFVVVAYLS